MRQEQSIKEDIKKLQKSRQFLAIMILLFVSLLFWVVVSLITSQTTEKIDPELKKLSIPLTPVLDTEIFDSIAKKREYSENELAAFTIFKVLLTKDGRTEKVVPLGITLDDLEPTESQIQKPNNSLLQESLTETNLPVLEASQASEI